MTYSYSGEGINSWDDTSQKSTDWVGSTEIGNFEASGWASTEEVTSFLRETLPPTHLENCRNIRYEPKLSAEHPNTVGVFDCKSREIIIGKGFEHLQGMEDKIESLTHQAAYNAYENIKINRPDVAKQWSDLHDQSLERNNRDGLGFVSSRANTNDWEDFAETYTTYVHDPEKLKFYSPEKYEFMRQEVFSAREYRPPVLSNITHSPTKLNFGSRTSMIKGAETRLPAARGILQASPKIDAMGVAETRLPAARKTTILPMPTETTQGTEKIRNIMSNPESGKS
jgi:hypothetical protein